MAEEFSLLSSIEQDALEVRDALPRARAIQAWLQLVTERELSQEVAALGADYLRTINAKQLKRIRKELVVATKLFGYMPLAFESSEGGMIAEPLVFQVTSGSVSTDALPTSQMYEDVGQVGDSELDVAQPLDEIDDGLSADTENGTMEAAECTSTALTPKGMKLAVQLLGDSYDFTDKAIDDIADDIYRKAGSPKTFVKGHKDQPIDGIERIKLRLLGLSNAEAAEKVDTTAGAFQIWFSVNVYKNIAKAAHGLETLEQEPATDTASPEDEVLVTELEKSAERLDHVALAKHWSKEMGLDQDEEEHLIQVLDSSFGIELNGVHKSVRHRFRLFMKDRLPPLESSDLDLDSNEIARLGALFGRGRQDGEYVFTMAPKSAYDIAHENGYLVPGVVAQLESALNKLYRYMSDASSAAVVLPLAEGKALEQTELPEELSDSQVLLRQLEGAGLSGDEAAALKACIEFDETGQPKPRLPEAKEALRKLQTILVKNGKQLDKEEDRDVIASLGMLTNVAFGQKTVRDVYYKLHGRDQSVTFADVTKLIQDGIIKLTT